MLEKLSNLSIIQTNGLKLKNIRFSAECILNHSQRKQSTEFMVDQYSDYSRSHDEFMSKEELSTAAANKGTLYSVSQYVPAVNTSYGSLCTGDAGYSSLGSDWTRDRVMSSSDDKNSEGFSSSDKHTSSDINSAASGSTTTTAPLLSGMSSTNSNDSQAHRTLNRNTCSRSNSNIGNLPTCVYFMSNIAVHLDMEDAPNATAEHILQAIVHSEEIGLNRQLAAQVFTLWMCSPILELQLKPTHKPYEVKKCWRSLLEQYSHGTFNKKQRDEPLISFQRNIFFSQQLEEKIKDQKIIELLYEEARYNILEGRYPCETAHYIMLGGIQARIELGPYNPQVHSTHYFREEQAKYLPCHVRKSSTWTWLPISSKNSAEVRLLEQFKRIPTSATNRKLMKKYLEFCWSLPYYGAA